MRRLLYLLSFFTSLVSTTIYRSDGFIRGSVSNGAIGAVGKFVGHLSSLGFFHSDSGPADLQSINPDRPVGGFSFKVFQPKDHGDLHSSVYIQAADGYQTVHHFTLLVQYDLSETGSAKYEIADIWFKVNKSERLQVCLTHAFSEGSKEG